MNNTINTIIWALIGVIVVCLILLEILLYRDRKFDKQVNQCIEMQRAIACGITHDQFLKMKMPRKLRAKFKQMHDFRQILAEIRNFIEEIEGSGEYQN